MCIRSKFTCSRQRHLVLPQSLSPSEQASLASKFSINLHWCPSPSPRAIWNHLSWNLSSRDFYRITISEQSLHHNWLSHQVVVPIQLPRRDLTVMVYNSTNTSAQSNHLYQPNHIVSQLVPGIVCSWNRSHRVCLIWEDTSSYTTHNYSSYPILLLATRRPIVRPTPESEGGTSVAYVWSSSHHSTCVLLLTAHIPLSASLMLTWRYSHANQYFILHYPIISLISLVALSNRHWSVSVSLIPMHSIL